MTTEFWDWAVAAYARAGVADACLALQDDHGQCVPLLLWAAWRADRGEGIAVAEAVRAAKLAKLWSDTVITPLRQARRNLKTPSEEGDDVERLASREKIKTMELDAERKLMERLSAGVPEKFHIKQEIGEALVIVARAWAENIPKDGLATLAEALTKA